jgi:large subunit ribosomal protein L1
MPSAKRGTVVEGEEEMKTAILEAQGAMDWRGDRNGVVRTGESLRLV